MIVLKDKNLFCQKYWQKVLKENNYKYKGRRLSESFDLPEINRILLGDTTDFKFDAPVQKKIALTDLEFKLIKPVEKPMILYRGVRNDISVFDNLFKNAKNIKEGEILRMPEYAFCTSEKDKHISEQIYAKNGILYKIHIPKGAKIGKSKSFFVLNRNSTFKCIQNRYSKENGYQEILLQYQLNQKQDFLIKNIINCIKDFVIKIQNLV